ncbi:MAG: hypothetical protein HFH41_09185 [Lachnospiraceae bacterium]|nr:hypothetical protein [Lachnospiraceae bacterium]
MNILIIGNGFDLAHGLPTKYGDFLDFCEKARRIYTFCEDASLNDYKCDNLDNWETNDDIKNVLLEAFDKRECKKNFNDNNTYNLKVTTSNKFLDELYTYIRKNTWLEYFLNCRSSIGGNWIDFETEISKVIQVLDEAINIKKSDKELKEVLKEKHNILLDVYKASKGSVQKALKDDTTLIDFAAFLDEELGRLIRALEIYIAEFVNRSSVTEKNVDIESLNLDHVLSFNYSDTYERIYSKGKKVECDYIHGKADISKNVNTSNLVLGIDEYLDDDKKDKDLELLSFKKFYQRIYKSTGNKYLEWVDEIKDGYADYLNPHLLSGKIEYPGHMLYIFGHSLDITDKDVLKMFICNDNVQTKIFYYRKNQEDKAELGKLIRNLILIMGQEELVRRTGGAHKTIEFVPQTVM